MIYTITEMTEKHYYGKAYVQYAAWFETYRGLMPDEFLDNRKLESCYESTLKHPQDTYVALSMMPHKEAVLYVLRGNNPAIGFYEHMGFMLTGNTFTQDTGFGNIVELEMMRTGRLTGP